MLPHSRTVLEPLAEFAVPRIHFGVGTGEFLDLIHRAGADVVGVDWRVGLDEAARRIGALPYVEVAQAVVLDHHRELRTGIPEMVYGASKTAEQITLAMRELEKDGGAIATRVDPARAAAVLAALPAAVYHEAARVVRIGAVPPRPPCGTIAVVCAGTSDLGVAEEAALVAEFLGAPVLRVGDVGVAGLHRLLARIDDIRRCDVVIGVAGMEAALPSVLGGLIDRPLIGVRQDGWTSTTL